MMTNRNESKAAVRLVEVDQVFAGQRLDNFLKRELKGVPKSRIYRLIRKGEVRVDKKRAKPFSQLSAGAIVRIPPIKETVNKTHLNSSLTSSLLKSIIFEDESVVVINKPSGLAVHAGSGINIGVIEALKGAKPEFERLELVHRIDRATSGCLMLAKDRALLPSLNSLFSNNNVKKQYLTLLKGRLPSERTDVEKSIVYGRDKNGTKTFRLGQDGKSAKSSFLRQQVFKDSTLARVNIFTGRTHQIRLHAAGIGFPVLGDELHGDFKFNRSFRKNGLKRLFLHAHRLELRLPSGKKISVEAPMANDLEKVLNKISAK